MGCDFISKVKDRIRKSWKAGFDEIRSRDLFSDAVQERQTIRFTVAAETSPAPQTECLVRAKDDGAIALLDGFREIGICRDVPPSVLDRIRSLPGSLAPARVTRLGVLTPTADVEIAVRE